MFKYIMNIINSKNPNLLAFKVTIIIGIILAIILVYKITTPPYEKLKQEGFTQKEQFVLKQNDSAYDSFYAEVYDGIHNKEKHGQLELIEIINMTQPSASNSVFLDVGSGTGFMVEQLTSAGYEAYGLEKSNAMKDFSEKVRPEAEVKCGDALDPMMYENLSFTHILCTDFTIYQLEDKIRFFTNCYNWLQPNGYLVVHLVDPDQFTINPTNNQNPFEQLFKKKTSSRDTDAMVEYYDFRYAVSYRFPNHVNKSNHEVTFTQTFTDKKTGHVRQNEQVLQMENVETISSIASKAGFLFQSKAILSDNHQYLYVFERPM